MFLATGLRLSRDFLLRPLEDPSFFPLQDLRNHQKSPRHQELFFSLSNSSNSLTSTKSIDQNFREGILRCVSSRVGRRSALNWANCARGQRRTPAAPRRSRQNPAQRDLRRARRRNHQDVSPSNEQTIAHRSLPSRSAKLIDERISGFL